MKTAFTEHLEMLFCPLSNFMLTNNNKVSWVKLENLIWKEEKHKNNYAGCVVYFSHLLNTGIGK